jgi:hypothetical protein
VKKTVEQGEEEEEEVENTYLKIRLFFSYLNTFGFG